jgi:hypothetical protein
LNISLEPGKISRTAHFLASFRLEKTNRPLKSELPFSNIFSMLKRKRADQEAEMLRIWTFVNYVGWHSPSQTPSGQRRTHEKGFASG